MKNIPKEIYLDIGYDPSSEDDFNDLKQVTWSKDNATGYGFKYVLESQLKDRNELLDRCYEDIWELKRFIFSEGWDDNSILRTYKNNRKKE